MLLLRYQSATGPAWGITRPNERGVFALEGNPYDRPAPGNRVGEIDRLKLLPPCEPSKIVALALNYTDMLGDRPAGKEPLIFFKPPTSLIGPGEPIEIPPGFNDVWVETELAFVVKQKARNVPQEAARACILGYTIANDVTARNIEGRDWHLARSKGPDTFCPVGPHLDTELDPSALAITTEINGRVTQRSTTANRIVADAEALSLISKFMTLMPGDLVLTGTPAGAFESLIKPGDIVRSSIEGLGDLIVPVVATAA